MFTKEETEVVRCELFSEGRTNGGNMNNCKSGPKHRVINRWKRRYSIRTLSVGVDYEPVEVREVLVTEFQEEEQDTFLSPLECRKQGHFSYEPVLLEQIPLNLPFYGKLVLSKE